MKKKNPLIACVFHIHSPKVIGYTALSVGAYAEFFRSVDKSVGSKINFQKPREFILSTNVITFANKLIGVLSRRKKMKCHILLLEMLEKDADVHIYDDLCEGIDLAVRNKDTTSPWCIGIAVSNHEIFQESVFLIHRLIKICEKNNIGLILISDAQDIRPKILFRGKLPKIRELPILQPSEKKREEKEEIEQRLSPEQIAAEFQILFGHFQIKINETEYHVPAVATVKKLAKNRIFLNQLKDDVSKVLNSSTFNIIPFGIPLGGINELSLHLVDGDTSRLYDPARIRKNGERPTLLLCDFLSKIYPIEDTIREVRRRGGMKIAVAAIARCEDHLELDGVPELFYIVTNYKTDLPKDSSCRFCKQGVPAIVGEHFKDFAYKIKQFEPFTFWEFISQSENFYRVGHWPSDRTPNHYLFRILTDPIFKSHSYCLSLRLRNILRSKGILPGWVRKIVCTEGEESKILSMGLAEILGLQQQDVVRIPRKFFASIAGKELSTELLKYIDGNYKKESLKKQNVLIVDQAAHHLKTFSALKKVCEYFNCAILAFAVFIDRTDVAFSLGEYLHDSHYISLYSWPIPPRRTHECPCMEEHL